MATWQKLYKLMVAGQPVHTILAKLHVKPYRLNQLLNGKRLEERLRVAERLAGRLTQYYSALYGPSMAADLAGIARVQQEDRPETARKAAGAVLNVISRTQRANPDSAAPPRPSPPARPRQAKPAVRAENGSPGGRVRMGTAKERTEHIPDAPDDAASISRAIPVLPTKADRCLTNQRESFRNFPFLSGRQRRLELRTLLQELRFRRQARTQARLKSAACGARAIRGADTKGAMSERACPHGCASHEPLGTGNCQLEQGRDAPATHGQDAHATQDRGRHGHVVCSRAPTGAATNTGTNNAHVAPVPRAPCACTATNYVAVAPIFPLSSNPSEWRRERRGVARLASAETADEL